MTMDSIGRSGDLCLKLCNKIDKDHEHCSLNNAMVAMVINSGFVNKQCSLCIHIEEEEYEEES